jgi:hypothetical protein
MFWWEVGISSLLAHEKNVFISYAPWRWKKLVTMIFITTINKYFIPLALLYTKTSIFSLDLIIYKNQYFKPLALLYTKTSIFFPWPSYIQKPEFFPLALLYTKTSILFRPREKILVFVFKKAKEKNTGFCI